MRLLPVILLIAMLAPPDVTLTTSMDSAGLLFAVHTTTPHLLYIEVETTDGLTAEPILFQCNLQADESCGYRVYVTRVGSFHLHPEYVHIRVWASGVGTVPVAEQSVLISTAPRELIYLPLV
jgi:hypothetical protein